MLATLNNYFFLSENDIFTSVSMVAFWKKKKKKGRRTDGNLWKIWVKNIWKNSPRNTPNSLFCPFYSFRNFCPESRSIHHFSKFCVPKLYRIWQHWSFFAILLGIVWCYSEPVKNRLSITSTLMMICVHLCYVERVHSAISRKWDIAKIWFGVEILDFENICVLDRYNPELSLYMEVFQIWTPRTEDECVEMLKIDNFCNRL